MLYTSLLITVLITSSWPVVTSAKEYFGLVEQAQEQPDNIGSNLQALYSEEQGDRRHAVHRLKELAQESPDNRAIIVADLIHMLDDPKAMFPTQRACMDLLGDFRATEAIEVLIRHIKDQWMTGMAEWHYPAIQALHQIGTPAIPDLAKALTDSTDFEVRAYSAQALGAIGGKVAQEKLEKALGSEKDSRVIQMIESQLRFLRASPQPK